MTFISFLEFMKLAAEDKEPKNYHVIDLRDSSCFKHDESIDISFDEVVGMMESSKCFVAYVEERP